MIPLTGGLLMPKCFSCHYTDDLERHTGPSGEQWYCPACSDTIDPAGPAAPLARLSALCGAPKRTRKPANPAGQPALLDMARPDAMVAFDGTVYVQEALL